MKKSLLEATLEIRDLKSKNETQSQEILKLRRDKSVFKAKLKIKDASFQKLKEKPPSNVLKKQILHEVLAPHFTPTQIDCLFRGTWHYSKKWSHEDIAIAVTLCSLSPRCYRHLRKTKMLPLPAPSTLKEFFRNFRIPQGYLSIVAKMVALQLDSMEPRDKVAVISFDEIYLRKRLDYDRQEDQILGPHKTANTMMIRGLFR